MTPEDEDGYSGNIGPRSDDNGDGYCQECGGPVFITGHHSGRIRVRCEDCGWPGEH